MSDESYGLCCSAVAGCGSACEEAEHPGWEGLGHRFVWVVLLQLQCVYVCVCVWYVPLAMC